MGVMRLLQILLMGLLFTAGEAMLPFVPVAETAAEEIAEETAHPSVRRQARRAPARADHLSHRVEAVSAAGRPVLRPSPAHADPGHRAAHRKVPRPEHSSSASPEDH